MKTTGEKFVLNNGTIQEKFHIGYVVGIKHNGYEWLINKTGDLCGIAENPFVFKTQKQAEKMISKLKHNNYFFRKYYYWKNVGKTDNRNLFLKYLTD